jgi:hypothetical protein
MVTSGIRDRFSDAVQRYELSVQTVARDGNCLFRSLSIMLEVEGRYNRVRQNVVQLVRVVSEGQIISLK